MTVAVIGGGASGMVAAIYAAKKGNEVVLIEKNDVCGKKLLITGNGRCNYFNTNINVTYYQTDNTDILNKIITEKNKQEILSFFESIGIIPRIKNNYYYPYSNKASSVRDALLCEVKLSGVKIIKEKVTKIIKNNDQFNIYFDNKSFINSDKVILATGSKAFSKTGSDGFGYDAAMSLGHKIIKPLPALTSLICSENYLKQWHGVRCEATVSLYENETLIKQETGELQLTDYGVSGICIFNLSIPIAKGLEKNKKEEILINFVPFINANNIETIIEYMDKRSELVSGRSVSEFLNGFLDKKLIKVILEKSSVNADKYYSDLNNKEKYRLALNLFSFKLNIKEVKNFDSAQTCSGGIPLSEINPSTMQSLIVDNLYITGELLDVAGDCGGYNLAFAFISGMLAGKSSAL